MMKKTRSLVNVKKSHTGWYSADQVWAKGQVGCAPGFVLQMPKSGQAARAKRYADSLYEKINARNLDWLRE